MRRLTGKVALITGASRGIGKGIAKNLAAEDAAVIVTYATSREGAQQTVEEIVKAGGQAWAIQGDFSKPEEITRAFNEVGTKHERLDVLVNNAGVAGFGPLEGVTAGEFHLAGSMPAAYGSIYSATKAAVNNIYISLSKELGPRQIRVNALNPGLVITDGLKAARFMEGDRYEAAVKGTPLGRAGRPDDIGKIAVFVASDESYWIAGQLIQAAGGVTL